MSVFSTVELVGGVCLREHVFIIFNLVIRIFFSREVCLKVFLTNKTANCSLNYIMVTDIKSINVYILSKCLGGFPG